MPDQFNDSLRIGDGHVWPCPQDSLNGKQGLDRVALTGCLGTLKSLPDDVFKIRIHTGIRAR